MSRAVVKKMIENNKKGSFGLQLAAMVDMFTVILMFMVFSQSHSTTTVEAIEGMTLPKSASMDAPVDAIKLVVTKTGIYLDNELIVNIKDGKIASEDLDKNDPQFLPKLYDVMDKFANRSRDIASKNEEFKFDGKVMLQADRTVDFGIMRKVMYTSAAAGYANLKIATLAK